jgi:hypothetical protein
MSRNGKTMERSFLSPLFQYSNIPSLFTIDIEF